MFNDNSRPTFIVAESMLPNRKLSAKFGDADNDDSLLLSVSSDMHKLPVLGGVFGVCGMLVPLEMASLLPVSFSLAKLIGAIGACNEPNIADSIAFVRLLLSLLSLMTMLLSAAVGTFCEFGDSVDQPDPMDMDEVAPLLSLFSLTVLEGVCAGFSGSVDQTDRMALVGLMFALLLIDGLVRKPGALAIDGADVLTLAIDSVTSKKLNGSIKDGVSSRIINDSSSDILF